MKTREWLVMRRPQHLVARIVCVFLAVVTWLCVMYITDPMLDYKVDHVFVTVADTADGNYIGLLDSSSLKNVRVRATKSAGASLRAVDIRAHVDLADLPAGVILEEDGVYELPVHFAVPENVAIEGSYTLHVRLKEKA